MKRPDEGMVKPSPGLSSHGVFKRCVSLWFNPSSVELSRAQLCRGIFGDLAQECAGTVGALVLLALLILFP